MASQYRQDVWVVQMTREKRGGFFLDTGAGMGELSSNTFRLEKFYGWTGICVEPVPEFFENLKAIRVCKCYNVVLSDVPGKVVYSLPENKWLSGIYSELTIAAKERSKADEGLKVELEAKTLTEILEDAKAPAVIDYWSLDTEGSEWTLIQSFPWNKHTVRLLTVEHNLEEPKRTNIQKFFKGMGFQGFQHPDSQYEDFYFNYRLPD